MGSSLARIVTAWRLLLFTLILLTLSATLAAAEGALFDLAGAPVTLTASMRTREYVWSYFNPGQVADRNNNYQYNFQSNVTLGADVVHKIKAGLGSIDLLIWGVYQIGSWGKLNQSSYAYTAQAGYRFDQIPWEPWLRALYTFGSGDSDAHDSTHGTFFQILPTPRIYALTPIYNMMNTNDLGGQLIVNPLRNLELRSDLDALWLSSSRDRWYVGGGAFDNHLFGYTARPSFGASHLGTLIDASASWKVCPHLGLYFYAGQVFGGSVVGANFPAGRALTLGYAESTISF